MLDIVRSAELDKQEVVFKWHGSEYEIDFSFDNVLRYFKLLDDKSIDKVSRAIMAFKMFIGDGLDVPLDEMISETTRISNLLAESPYESVSSGSKVFDYEQDSEAIYASFLKEYGIDLIEQKGKLSYFKFTALLNHLSSKAPINRIIQIRTENPADHAKDARYLQALAEMQQTYALKKSADEIEQEKQAQLENAFEDF
jgi:hypothetical protein